jgi:phenylalanyl-tRNA synthetase beta chain
MVARVDTQINIMFFFNSDPTYFPGRCAAILCKNKIIGKIGVLHPSVLHAFEVTNPCAAVEFTMEEFV